MEMDFENIFQGYKSCTSIAVSESNEDFNYAEFSRYVLAAKNYFLQNRISKVLICLPQGFEAYTLIWGAYLAGTVFCPIHENTPNGRVNVYKQIFEPDFFIQLNESDSAISPLSFFETAFALNEIITFERMPSSIAYVIFTSGSTGIPKGVKITRKGLSNFLIWTTAAYGLKPDDIYGQYSGLGFDLSICDIFTAIICGSTLVPVSGAGEKLLPATLIKKKQITFWHSVPSVIDAMQKAKQLNADHLGSLKTMTFCGEPLYPSHLELLFEANPALIIFNTYGPTEITIFCTQVKLTNSNYRSYCSTTVAIGDPLPGYEFTLQNIEDSIGEIVIAGSYIAEGYLGLSSSVETGFRHILRDNEYVLAYSTGDFAERKGGQVYFKGRRDSQIKINGFRVDTAEIDYQLRTYGCQSAITVLHKNRLISFVCIDHFDENAIKSYLKTELPPYYIPLRLYNRSSFPTNASGKTDTEKLILTLND